MLVATKDLYKYISPTTVAQGVQIYEFKVTLRRTNPKVERQILVQGDYTLEQLGRVAACAIGWHRNPFDLIDTDGSTIKGDRPWGHDHNRDDTDSEAETDAEETVEGEAFCLWNKFHFFGNNFADFSQIVEILKPKTAKEIYISEHFVRQKKTLVMDYDKYRWIHDIKLVKIHERDRKHYPKCISGQSIIILKNHTEIQHCLSILFFQAKMHVHHMDVVLQKSTIHS